MAQKPVLYIAKEIAPLINIQRPAVLLAATDLNLVKLSEVIRATCDDLVVEHDWQSLVTSHTITTSIGVSTYEFPTDVSRWLGGTLHTSQGEYDLPQPLTARQWTDLTVNGGDASQSIKYRVRGNLMEISPTPTEAYTITYEYISSNYAYDPSLLTYKETFLADSDVILFDHALVKYGAILKWIEGQRGDTSAALADYKRALAFQKGYDTDDAIVSAQGPTYEGDLPRLNYNGAIV